MNQRLKPEINRQLEKESAIIKKMNAAGFSEPFGLYDPTHEHDSCGVGFLTRLDGKPQHSIIRDAIRILINLEHRGAVGGAKATGDGATRPFDKDPGFFLSQTADRNAILSATSRTLCGGNDFYADESADFAPMSDNL